MTDYYVSMPKEGKVVDSIDGRSGVVVLTKADVDLANVDNTSDASKPVSTAQQTALNLKASLVDITASLTVPDPLPQGIMRLQEVPEIPTTGMTGGSMLATGIGSVNFSIISSVLDDLTKFGSYDGTYGYVSFTAADAPTGMVVITPSPPQMGNLNILFGTTSTWNDVIAAVNAWAATNLSSGVAPICSLSEPADGTLIPSPYQSGVYLNGNGAQAVMNIFIQSIVNPTKVYQGSIY
jgi:hypothetical protein